VKKILAPGESFGELAMLHANKRSATVKTMEPCELWAIDRYEFKEVVQSLSLQTYMEKKKLLDEIVLFQHLKWNEKDVMAQALLYQRYAPGSRIICERDLSDEFYIIVEGTVSI
jgi:cAMP-dependent protein kinase regulator